MNTPWGLFRRTVHLLTVFTLLAAFTPFDARRDRAPLATTTQPIALNAGSDSDQDGLADAEELRIARLYGPKLVFDEAENQKVLDSLLVLFQATPVYAVNTKVAPPTSRLIEVILTFEILYSRDKGADVGGCGVVDAWDLLTQSLRVLPGVSQRHMEDMKGGHCGDAETLKITVELTDRGYHPTDVIIRRHGNTAGPYTFDDLELEHIKSGQSGCQADSGTCHHPRIYVSQNKHAMYVSGGECEAAGDVKLKKAGMSCTISWEDCSEGGEKIPKLADSQNVGETGRGISRYTRIGEINQGNSSLYANEYIWSVSGTSRDDVFCGGKEPNQCDIGCADGLGDNWEVFGGGAIGKSPPPEVIKTKAPNAPTIPDGPYTGPTSGFIVSYLSGKCIDVAGAAGTASGAALTLYTCEFDKSSTDQKWWIDENGYFVNQLSGKCLDVAGAGTTKSGARLQLWDCEFGSKTTDQRWAIREDGLIINKLAGKCLDVPGPMGSTDGLPLQLWDCDWSAQEGTDQRWYIR